MINAFDIFQSELSSNDRELVKFTHLLDKNFWISFLISLFVNFKASLSSGSL